MLAQRAWSSSWIMRRVSQQRIACSRGGCCVRSYCHSFFSFLYFFFSCPALADEHENALLGGQEPVAIVCGVGISSYCAVRILHRVASRSSSRQNRRVTYAAKTSTGEKKKKQSPILQIQFRAFIIGAHSLSSGFVRCFNLHVQIRFPPLPYRYDHRNISRSRHISLSDPSYDGSVIVRPAKLGGMSGGGWKERIKGGRRKTVGS